jgi:Na+/H+ antiporter NhaD/arsenite permease-like protein
MARDRWPALPLGRALSVSAVAALFVASSLLSPAAAFAAVNVPTLALLLGCMLVSGVAEAHGAFALLEAVVASGAPAPLLLLLRVSGAAALSSAFITNDATCVVLTPLVLRVCLTRKLHPAPFLLALATSSNVGSAASPIGNPQNMIIALMGSLLFAADFLRGVLAAALIGLVLNAAVIASVYRRELFGGAEFEASPLQLASLDLPPSRCEEEGRGERAVSANAGAGAGAGASAGAGVAGAVNFSDSKGGGGENDDAAAAASEDSDAKSSFSARGATTVELPALAAAVAPQPSPPSSPAPALLRRRLIFFVLAALPAALVAADSWVGLPWMSLLAAALLLVLDGGRPDAVLARVDAPLLLFFSGLFVVVAGLGATGLPRAAWDAASAAGVGLRGGASGVALFTVVVSLGSNTVSNVPLVLLLAPSVAALTPAEARPTWLLLAFVSTVAGNFTLVGSVANLIVAERAKAAFELSFAEYARVGVPSTFLVLLVGVPIVVASSR